MNELIKLLFKPITPANWYHQPTYTSLYILRTEHPNPPLTCNYIGTITARYTGLSQALVLEILSRHVNDAGSELISHTTLRVTTGPVPLISYTLSLTFRTHLSLLQPDNVLEEQDVELIGSIPVTPLPVTHPMQVQLNNSALVLMD